nr:hypothetical protein [Tanacetum cinerariifolium]
LLEAKTRRRDNYRQGSKVEEHALKALMAIDGVGWDWSYMVNDEENHALVADTETPTEFSLMANINAETNTFKNFLGEQLERFCFGLPQSNLALIPLDVPRTRSTTL